MSLLFILNYLKKNKKISSSQRNGIFFALSFFVLNLFFGSTVLATVYQPGETLEPDCAPGSDNCGVASFTLNSQSSSTQTMVTGSSGSNFNIVSGSNVHTFNLPDAGATSRGLVSTSSQFFAGEKTFSDGLSIVGNFFTPAGSSYYTTGSQNDVDFGNGTVFYYLGNGDATFTGLAGGQEGRLISIINHTNYSITFKNDSVLSQEGNRFSLPGSRDIILPSDAIIRLIYSNGTENHWDLFSLPAIPETVGNFAFIQNGNAFGSTVSLGTTDANGLNLITAGNTRFSLASNAATLTGNGATTLNSNNSLSLLSAAGSNLSVVASTTGILSLDTGSTGAINIGTNSNAKTITIGNNTGATTLNLISGSGGINMTGLVTISNASVSNLAVSNNIIVGSTATSTISGNNGLSTLRSDLLVTGSTTLQNVILANATTTGSFYATNISGSVENATLARLGNTTFSTLQDMQNVFHSAGWTSGGQITDLGGGVASVAAGTGLLRPSDSALSTVYYADWSASTSVAIPNGTIRHIGIEYNSGSPRVTSRSSSNWNYKTDFPLGVVANEGGVLHIANDVQGVGDHAANMIRREYETMPLERDSRNGGLILSESADTNRYVSITAGALWDRLNRYSISTIDTSVSGTFDTYMGETEIATGQTQWDNMNYNNSGVLTALADGKYAVLWFYIDTSGELSSVYGTGQYNTLAAATVEDEPMDLPLKLVATGKLVGRLIFQKSSTIAAEVDGAFGMSKFNSQSLTHLSNLSDLDFDSSGLTGFVGSNGVTGGQIIIGGKSATDGLTLQSTSATGTTDFIKFLVGTNGSVEAARFTDSGNFGIGTTTPSSKLTVSGQTASNNFVASSASATSSFAGPVTMAGTLSVSGLTSIGSLTATGESILQTITGVNSTFTNVTTTNLVVSSSSTLGTIISGVWDGTSIDATHGGTNQSSWTKGDLLYASGANTLSKLPIGSAGTVLTVAVAGVPTWAAAGVGGGGSNQWATSTDGLVMFPAVPTTVVLVGASATTSLGQDVNAILEVTGNSLLSGTARITGLATLSAGVSTTNANITGNLYIGGNATTTASGAFSTNGLITASAVGTGISVVNDASIGGLATISNILTSGTATINNLLATSSVFVSASTTNLYATNFNVDNFSPANLSTNGTLTVVGHASLSTVSTTGNLYIGSTLLVGGFTTTTNGIVNTQTKYQIAGTDVLSSNTLGSGITNSSLTSLGTLGSLTVSGQTNLSTVSTTGNLYIGSTLLVGGFTTTTNGIVNTQTKYQIAGTDVLSSNTLGSGITNSSLTSLGTLGSLTVSGQTNLSTVSTTGALSVAGSLSVGGVGVISANGNFSTTGTITSGAINGQTISSAANFTGTVTAASLVTASNGLTLVSGTLTLPSNSVADSALSSNVALLNSSGQTFSGTNNFSALTTFGNVSSTNVTVSSSLVLSGDFSTPKGSDYPTTGSQNDVDLGSGSLFRYTGLASATFTGIAGGSDGKQIRIVNASSFSLILSNQSISSVAANRIITGSGSDLTIPANVSVGLQYDSGASRWRVVVLPATSGTINSFAFIQSGNAFGTTASLGTTDANGLNFITAGNNRFSVASNAATLTGNGATTITTNNSLTLSSASGSNLSITAGTTGSVTLDSGTTGAVNLGTGSSAKTINIGTGTAGDNINIGTNNTVADTITLGSALDSLTLASTGLNVSSGGALTGVASIDTISYSSTAVTFAGAGALSSTGANSITVDSGTTGAVNLGTGSSAKTINIGTGTAGDNINIGTNNTVADTITLGSALDSLTLASTGLNVSSGGALTGVASIDTISYSSTAVTFAGAGALSSTGANSITVDSGTTGAVNLGTGSSAKTITVGNTTGASALVLQSGSGNIKLEVGGSGTTGNIRIGGTAGATPDLLVLDTKNTSGDPTGVAGAMYYNSNLNKFRCYENGGWANCITAASGATPNNIKSSDATGAPLVASSQTNAAATSVNITTGASEVWAAASVEFDKSAATAENESVYIYRDGSACGTGGTQLGGTYNFNTKGGAADKMIVAVNFVEPSALTAGTHTYRLCVTTGAAATVSRATLTTMEVLLGADTAELYGTNDDRITMGDVVSIDPNLVSGVKKSEGEYDSKILGVVSTKPSLLMGSEKRDGVNSVPVALSGRVPVKVSSENGVIKIGDYLTSSKIPGVAMKATKGGMTIGQAITPFEGEGEGEVIVFVKNTYFPGESSIDDISVVLGDVTPKLDSTSTDNGLSTLVATIQAEKANNPISIIESKITTGKQFLTNFIVARVTAIRGYFDEIFARKVHTEQICLKKLDGSEVCINGDQIQNVVNGTTSVQTTDQQALIQKNTDQSLLQTNTSSTVDKKSDSIVVDSATSGQVVDPIVENSQPITDNSQPVASVQANEQSTSNVVSEAVVAAPTETNASAVISEPAPSL